MALLTVMRAGALRLLFRARDPLGAHMAAIAVRFRLKPGDEPGAASHGRAAGYIP